MWEVAIAVVIIGAIFYFLKLSNQFDDEHVALKILFLFVSFFLTIIGLGLAVEFADWHGASAGVISNLSLFYQVTVWILIFTFGYFIIYWIFKMLIHFGVITDKNKVFHYINKSK
jgi:hypothetical protein